MDHVTDESSGHVTGKVEEELYLPLYKSYISGSCDQLSATISMGHVTDESLVGEWRRIGSSRTWGSYF